MLNSKAISAKKSLGQNFLHDKNLLKKIVEGAGVKPGDTVLEVGPGKGALTAELLLAGADVIAVEKDDRLIPFLEEKFTGNPRFKLLHGDILELLPEKIVTKPYKIVANLPYYITGAFFEHIFSCETHPESITVMLQKEVAERMVAKDGKESILSQSIKAYGVPKYLFTVPRGAFSPVPNVDSAVLQITQISKRFFQAHTITEAQFFDTVKRGFAHKRKKVGSNLGLSDEELLSCGVTPNERAEKINQATWATLARTLAGKLSTESKKI